jgi:hypothetical protein
MVCIGLAITSFLSRLGSLHARTAGIDYYVPQGPQYLFAREIAISHTLLKVRMVPSEYNCYRYSESEDRT